MSDIEWSPWLQHTGNKRPVGGETIVHARLDGAETNVLDADKARKWSWGQNVKHTITHYRIPMEDYRRITGMPSWDEVPEWVRFIAQWPSDGRWIGYRHKPDQDERGYQVEELDDISYLTPKGTVLGDWRDTLQERPAKPDIEPDMGTHPDSELDADQHSVGADSVDHPSHYTSGSIECIDAIQAQMTPEQFAGYLRGNVAKYLWRYEHKGGAESLRKARWYLDRLIAVMENE